MEINNNLQNHKNPKRFVGESAGDKFDFVVMKKTEGDKLLVSPVWMYKFVPEDWIKSSESQSKEDIENKKRLEQNKKQNRKKRIQNLSKKLEDAEGVDQRSQFEITQESDNVLMDELLRLKQKGVNVNNSERTGDLVQFEASDDEGMEEDVETPQIVAEDYEDKDPADEEEKRYLDLIRGKSGLNSPKTGGKDAVSARKEAIEIALERQRENKLEESIEQKVVNALKKKGRLSALSLVREVASDNSKEEKEVLLKVIKRVAVMKSVEGRKFLELKEDFSTLNGYED